MNDQLDDRLPPSNRVLIDHVMPGHVPWELSPYVHPLTKRATEELKKQKVELSPVSLEALFVQVVQVYYREQRKRFGPTSSSVLKRELEPLKEVLSMAVSKYEALSREAKAVMPWSETLSSSLTSVMNAIQQIDDNVPKRGRPPDKHIAKAVDLIAQIWEQAHAKKMGKTLDKHKESNEYTSQGPFFIQAMFSVLDPYVKLTALDNAIAKRRDS